MGQKSIPRRVFELLSGHPLGLTTEKIAEHLEDLDEYQVQNGIRALVKRKMVITEPFKGARKLFRINPEHPQANFLSGRPEQTGFQEGHPGDLFGDSNGMEGSSPAPPAEPHPEPQPDRGHSGQEHPVPPLDAGLMVPLTKTTNVEDLPVHWIDGEPMVYDLDMAEALGYSKAPNIRKPIAGLIAGGAIGPEGFFSAAEKNEGRGRPGTAYYLGEKAALKVVTKSETPKADAITDQVIDTFIQARKGKFPKQVSSQPAEPLSDPLRTASMYLEAGKLFGTDEPTAKAVAAEQVRRIHDIDFRPLLANNQIAEEDRFLCPRDLGALVDMLARAINLLLEQEGYQYRPKQGKYKWLPTSEAEGYYAWHPIQDPNGNARYQLLWDRDILNLLGFL